ncbi:hypothetical protein BLNAU_19705 [Blattamonas nauphoetae]|uniref:Uncharacterized protein n=1 Tax=Blattamonas nauphoetae TaxID=2049346 RepID=A0ABQ9X104_9EUKA|nr:hypothetical protein BLNAU_19705 [Blattamonas nauphoetae]
MGCKDSKACETQVVSIEVPEIIPASFKPFASTCLESTGNTVTLTGQANSSTAIINFLIRTGIWSCTIIFRNSSNNRFVGLIEDSFSVPDFYWAGTDNHSAGFSGSNGSLYHNGDVTDGLSQFSDSDKITIEVNMASEPRTAVFFVNGVLQRTHLINLPDCVNFCASMMEPDSSFTVESITSVSPQSASHPIEGSVSVVWAV